MPCFNKDFAMKQHEIPHATQNDHEQEFSTSDFVGLQQKSTVPFQSQVEHDEFLHKGGDLRTTAFFARQKVDGTQALTANDRGGWKVFARLQNF